MSFFKSISPLFLLSACFSTSDSDPLSTILFQIEDDSIDQHECIIELKPLETPKHVDILPEYKNEDSYLYPTEQHEADILVEIDLLYALTVYKTDLVEPLEETGLYQHLGDIQTEQTVSFQNDGETSYVIDLHETDLVEPLEETGLYQHLGDIQTEQTVSFQNDGETSYVIDLHASTD